MDLAVRLEHPLLDRSSPRCIFRFYRAHRTWSGYQGGCSRGRACHPRRWRGLCRPCAELLHHGKVLAMRIRTCGILSCWLTGRGTCTTYLVISEFVSEVPRTRFSGIWLVEPWSVLLKSRKPPHPKADIWSHYTVIKTRVELLQETLTSPMKRAFAISRSLFSGILFHFQPMDSATWFCQI